MQKSKEENEKFLKNIFLRHLGELPDASKKIFPVDEDTAALEALRVYRSFSGGRRALLAAPSYGIAEQLHHEIGIWAAAAGLKLSSCLLPEGSWRDTVTLDDEAERAEALALAAGENPPDLFIGSVLAFLSPAPNPREFCGSEMILHRDAVVPMGALIEKLVALGYDDEPEAVAMGEFSRRGGILDIYSPGMRYPVRLEFFGDQIESMREYSPDSGRSLREIDVCRVIARSGCESVEGGEYFDFSDYAGERFTILYSPEACLDALRKYGGIHAEEHWKSFLEKQGPVYELASEIECAERGIPVERDCIGVSPALRASAEESAEAVTELSRRLSVDFVSRSLDSGMHVVLAAAKESDAEHIAEWLRENRLAGRAHLSVRKLFIPCGILLPKQKMVFLTERELFPAVLRGKERVRPESSPEEDVARASAGELENMADIEVGDLTVHLNYGLCRYRGLKNIRSGGSSIESLVLEFDDGRYALIEIKLGYEYAVDSAAKNLLKIADKLERKPSFLAVVSGTAPMPLKRPDGVYVLPLTSLKP